MRRCVLALCLVVLFGQWLSVACAENYTGDFLTNGVGGRALGMGGAYAALADDVTATYWNPAGIAHVPDKSQIGFMHAARRSGLGGFSYAGAVSRINTWLALGASWIHAGVDDIPIYPAFDPNTTPGERQNVAKFRPTFEPSGFLSDSENAYVLTVGVKQAIGQAWWNNFGRDSRPPEFSMGVNVKWVSQSLGGSRADPLQPLEVLVDLAVAEIQTDDVHARPHQALERVWRVARWSDGCHDLRAPGHTCYLSAVEPIVVRHPHPDGKVSSAGTSARHGARSVTTIDEISHLRSTARPTGPFQKG